MPAAVSPVMGAALTIADPPPPLAVRRSTVAVLAAKFAEAP
jgi:hypothetical protein